MYTIIFLKGVYHFMGVDNWICTLWNKLVPRFCNTYPKALRCPKRLIWEDPQKRGAKVLTRRAEGDVHWKARTIRELISQICSLCLRAGKISRTVKPLASLWDLNRSDRGWNFDRHFGPCNCNGATSGKGKFRATKTNASDRLTERLVKSNFVGGKSGVFSFPSSAGPRSSTAQYARLILVSEILLLLLL